MRPITSVITYIPTEYKRYMVAMYHSANALGLEIDFDNYDMDNMEEIDGYFVYLRRGEKYINKTNPIVKEWTSLYRAEKLFWDFHWMKEEY